MDALQMLQQDLPALIVGVALCTIAAGLFAFALLGRRIANIDLPIAGAFAALYGIRLIIRTQSITAMLGNPAWIHYVHADLEYLVPVPGALLFQRFFGGRLRWLNRIATIAFIVSAAVGVPYDIATRHPGAFASASAASLSGFFSSSARSSSC